MSWRGLKLAVLAALLAVAAVPALAQVPAPAPEPSARVVGARFTGLVRTNAAWLASYIDLEYPTDLTKEGAKAIARKLFTTGVFTEVKVELEALPPEGFVLHVHVEEKWTTIPVLRGAYGGGTPMRVVGAYDIHAFGRLVTLGAEGRKYGDAPYGFVLFARDPRHQAGRYYIGGEVWREFRVRQLYDEGEAYGKIATNTTLGRVRLLRPFDLVPQAGRAFPWRLGIELESLHEAPSFFELESTAPAGKQPPADLPVNAETQRAATVLAMVQYDGLEADLLTIDGLRVEAKAGPVFGTRRARSRGQLEAFWYRRLPADLNLGVHAFAYDSKLSTLHGTYFLGGLDSIRGLPDGALYGLRAAYANAELRHVAARMRYLWVQTVAFTDAGLAGPTWQEAGESARAVAGVGLRFGVPQVYRMVLRIDYAWGIDGSGARGLAAGMNHFFDPYRPLER